jgi:hypothetical protein
MARHAQDFSMARHAQDFSMARHAERERERD